MAADGEVWYLTLGSRRVELPEGELVVGRSRDCDLVIRDASVSRAHTLISVVAGRVTVQDLGSSNGTLVNGDPVREETEVRAGDQLRLGRMRLAVGRGAPAAGGVGTAVCPACRAPLAPGLAVCGSCGEEIGGERRLSRSEAVSVSDVLPVGEAIARPARSLEDTRPPFPLAWDDEEAGRAGGGGSPVAAGDPSAAAAEDAASPAATAVAAPARPRREEADLPPRRPDPGGYLPAAGFWPRSAAFLVDVLWIGGLGTVVTVAAGGPMDLAGVAAGLGFTLLLWALVAVAGWSRRGDSPGKRLFRLCVCDLDGRPGISAGRALGRWAAYAASALPLGVGFLAAGLTASRRGFHDRLSGTYVGQRER